MITVEALLQLVRSDSAVAALAEASAEELEALFGKEFAAMQGYDQNNPHHCYDLLRHTIHTVLGIDQSLPQTEFELLRIAALFHDIGKPSVSFKKEGRTVYYNHAQRSVLIAEKRLLEIGFDKDRVEKICFFIENHDMFISFKSSEEVLDHAKAYEHPINLQTVRKALEKVIGEAKAQHKYVPQVADFRTLLLLCFADAGAQSEEVYMKGKLVATKAQKLQRLREIQALIEQAFPTE